MRRTVPTIEHWRECSRRVFRQNSKAGRRACASSSRWRFWGSACARLLAVLLLLASCSQELYANLDEREINAMIAALARYNIRADKIALKDGYSISVPSRYFADSINILSAAGYPQRKYVSLNELFGKSGLIPTPFEEHVRYIYGLSEELARTVSLFDGVIEARVHIALPAAGEKAGAKVSVFIKYDQQFDYETLVPRIRKFVSDSVEKVEFDNVEVLALPGQKSADFYRIRRKLAEERRPVRVVEFTLGGLAVGALFLITLFVLRKRGVLAFSRPPSQPLQPASPLAVRQAASAAPKTIADADSESS